MRPVRAIEGEGEKRRRELDTRSRILARWPPSPEKLRCSAVPHGEGGPLDDEHYGHRTAIGEVGTTARPRRSHHDHAWLLPGVLSSWIQRVTFSTPFRHQRATPSPAPSPAPHCVVYRWREWQDALLLPLSDRSGR
jgi:hypothetical protein